MNREIKFKAWDEEMECMSYSSDTTDNDHFWVFDDGKIIAFGWIDTLGNSMEPPDREPYQLNNVMQFIGLKDIHGKEIYEGDILKGYLIDKDDIDYSFTDIVSFSDGRFQCEKYADFDLYIYELEIIGNIYTNK